MSPNLSLHLGDMVEVLAEFPDESVHAIVTDPPYGINFMGKAWDGTAIQQAAETKRRDTSSNLRLTGSPDSPARKLIPRSGSAYQNRAGEAGAYDFSINGNRAFQAWVEQWGRECLRVLKPGGFALVFGGTRTSHRLACGLEDAGFEIRDEILAWMFGSGFPKSLDVSKAIDKAARGVPQGGPDPSSPMHGRYKTQATEGSRGGGDKGQGYGAGPGAFTLRPGDVDTQSHVPESELAAAWHGWGTALKPAHEPIIVARKPLAGTVAANVLAHGTGAINIDGCRIAFQSSEDEDEAKDKNRHGDFGSKPPERVAFGRDDRESTNYDPPGRWPANVVLVHHEDCVQVGSAAINSDGHFPGTRPGSVEIGTVGHSGQTGLAERDTKGEHVDLWECVDGCPVRGLDEQTGQLTSGRLDRAAITAENRIFGAPPKGLNGIYEADSGGASRFFYCAKVSRAERNAGLEGLDAKPLHWSSGNQSPGTFQSDGTDKSARNNHPTVKPIALMRWLIRLVTPPGGTVLDPFLGSGSTGIAAGLEGFQFIGIEREPDYMRIAEARIAFWRELGEDGLRILAEREAGEKARQAIAESGQMSLLGDRQ